MSATTAGFSPARLAVLDRVIKEKYVGSGAAPCTFIQVWRRGELAHSSLSGLMDIERNRPMREDAIVRILSMSKPITAVALLMLMEEGRIDLEDEVADFIPEWTDLGVYAGGEPGSFRTTPQKRPMKIIDLASHTSGLTYDWMESSPVDVAYGKADVWHSKNLDDLIEKLGKIPLDFSPGEFWNYSMGMDVIGYIVEKCSGMSFGEFLTTRLFVPLGMADTAFGCPLDKIDRFASCYEAKDGKLTLHDDGLASTDVGPKKLETGGSGLVSTMHDYMRFCRMLLGGGALEGVRIVGPKSVAMLGMNMISGGRTIGEASFQGRAAPWRMDGDGYSLCTAVTLGMSHKLTYGSPGDLHWGGAAMSQFWVDPAEDLAVVFISQVLNSPHLFEIQRVLRALVYAALED